MTNLSILLEYSNFSSVYTKSMYKELYIFLKAQLVV